MQQFIEVTGTPALHRTVLILLSRCTFSCVAPETHHYRVDELRPTGGSNIPKVLRIDDPTRLT